MVSRIDPRGTSAPYKERTRSLKNFQRHVGGSNGIARQKREREREEITAAVAAAAHWAAMSSDNDLVTFGVAMMSLSLGQFL